MPATATPPGGKVGRPGRQQFCRAEFARLYLAGAKMAVISLRLRTSKETLRKVRAELGLPGRPPGNSSKKVDRAEFARLFLGGVRAQELADRFDVALSHVYRISYQLGLSRPRPERAAPRLIVRHVRPRKAPPLPARPLPSPRSPSGARPDLG